MDDSTPPSCSINDKNAVPSLAKVNLTLLIDKRNKRVLYAEAGKDFVDFLFGLFELPAGFVLALLIGRGFAPKGSICRIYENIRDFDHHFLQNPLLKLSQYCRPMDTNTTKQNPLLNELVMRSRPTVAVRRPKQEFASTVVPGQTGSYSPGLQASDSVRQPVSSLLMENIASEISQQQRLAGSRNPWSGSAAANPNTQANGYVKGVTVRYMVMDDLTVKPMFSVSSFQLLKSFQVKDVDSLEEKTVEVDLETGLRLVEASIKTTTVLTSIFFPALDESEADVEVVAKENFTISKKRK